ncbi:DUF3772 domain-containing protein [Dyella soli]|uniref:Mechanosensitive ion channel family protein n=1 Tax=Dyella soli TaxID=522319 RepID=A0A4R0YUJ8_9GAMM|nr:DUF3772 domain-containing protein [Dyella soli]TCI10528.1 mechanosensitive ion channel family protein [Dyella soli]
MPILSRLLLIVLLALGTLPALADNGAQNAPAPLQAPTVTADQLSQQLDQIKQGITDRNKLTDELLVSLRTKTASVGQQADQLSASLTPQADSLKAKLDVLGPAPEKGAPPESADVTNQRKQLSKDKADLDGRIKQAKTLSLESQSLINQIASLRRDLFQAQISQRTESPLTLTFWQTLARNTADDRPSALLLGSKIGAAMSQAWQPGNRLPFGICITLSLALLAFGRRFLESRLLGMASRHLPSGHLRRSAMAVLIALSTSLTYGLAAWLGYLAFNWNGVLDQDVDDLVQPLVRLVFFAACLSGLGRALLCVNHPSWRLAPFSDDLARRLRLFPTLLAYCTLMVGLVALINDAIGASVASAVATNALAATLICGLIGAMLLTMGRARRALLASGEQPARRPLWVGLLVGGAVLGVLLALLGVLSGYIALAFFLTRQMIGSGFIIVALYLLMHLANDLFESLLSPESRSGTRLQESFGISAPRLEQTSTVLSGITRVFLLLLTLPLVLAPFGAGPAELMSRGSQLFAGRSLGSLQIVPGNIFSALMVLLIGTVILRVIKRWLSQQLLPKTSFDVGMQTSIVTMLGYLGGILVFVLVLGALQVDVKSIAWVASALSVGIGFGLQAIVQNFISGLILLAERPVKVGDWVSIPGVEGDIRRINVRATEIQMGDRSTMIVPNSQLITQNVRNVTLANAQGRVQIRLPMPMSSDASKVRQLIFDILHKHPATLNTPAPTVQLDSIDTGSLLFVCTAYVSSPRDASNVKSDLLFEIIERLRKADLPLTTPQDMVVRTMAHDSGTPPNPLTTAVPAGKT